MHDLFSQPTASQLAQQGLKVAVSNADRKTPEWSVMAWSEFLEYLELKKRNSEINFQIEDFVLWLEMTDSCPMPNSKRAFGFIAVRAMKLNLIERIGFQKTQNRSAHGAISNVYRIK